jgi:hypothetical protein
VRTLLLATDTWDLTLDHLGNIAVADDPYSQAQDAASAIRLFEGELYYDTTKGVPYWVSILGRSPPLALMKAKFVEAALTVPGVVEARCFIQEFTDRMVAGQVQIANDSGLLARLTF